MNSKSFLFLTNAISDHKTLITLKKNPKNFFNFALHSYSYENEHFIDLRNLNAVKRLLNADTILILFLTGELSLFVLNEFLKDDDLKRRKIFFISNLSAQYLPKKHPSFITAINCKNLLNKFFQNATLVNFFLGEDEYFQRLDDYDFFDYNQLNFIVLSIDAVIREIINREKKRLPIKNDSLFLNNEFKNFLNENYGGVKKKITHQLLNPKNYFFDKERRVYLQAFSNILVTDFNNRQTIETKNIPKEIFNAI